MNNRKLMTGAEIVVRACQDAGAKMMYGYPITPATEVLTGWISSGGEYLQTEDEIAAGFAVCGAVLAGQKCFTATSGPGHVLMQDGLSMAEGMRLPFVLIAAQRGGPSSGTVVYSQQEVILACYGGNGEGMRLVYSPATLEELHRLTVKAFDNAWRYRFPAIVLTDGYTLKTRGVIEIPDTTDVVVAQPLIGVGETVHWRNIYTLEEELSDAIAESRKDFSDITPEVVEYETVNADNAETIIIAHGIVGLSAKEAVENLIANGKSVGLFRPVTLRPFPKSELDRISARRKVKRFVVVESSAGQLARIVRDELAPEVDTAFFYLQKPGLGIEPEEIEDFVNKI